MPRTTLPARPRAARRAATLAAALLLGAALLWGRGTPLFVGWEVARDHDHCLRRAHLRARLWTSEPAEARSWLESRGTPVPPLPTGVDGLLLIGVRYCPLADRIAAHVFYGGEKGHVSVFVLSGPARVGDGWRGTFGDLNVRLLRSAGRTLAIVGASRSDVEAMARAFHSSVA
jgi:hypothetical protein